MTLIEVMVVIVIVALVMAGVVFGGGQLGMARLKHTATAVSGAVRVAYVRATATSKSERIVFDLDANKMWLEEGDAPMLVQASSKSAAGGADPVTEEETKAATEADGILKGPKIPKPHFRAIAGISISGEGAPSDGGAVGGKGPIPLPRGITFRSVQSIHDDAPRTSGRAYLYFWPGGMTERANIQVRLGQSTDDADTLTLVVSPLTGKVTVKPGALALEIPTDDKSASEREDIGF